MDKFGRIDKETAKNSKEAKVKVEGKRPKEEHGEGAGAPRRQNQ